MAPTAYVIDVESGNLQLLQNALEFLGYQVVLVRHAGDDAFAKADRLFLPGVGNYGHFVKEVVLRGFVEPIRQYIASGRPMMGICVGLQSFFEKSAELPDADYAGLGFLDLPLTRFNANDPAVPGGKSVPAIGWNTVSLSDRAVDQLLYGIDQGARYYFVHSYAAIVTPAETATITKAGWSVATATYGSETFLAAVAKDNLFATQFHPEKSGTAGLRVIDHFMKGTATLPAVALPPRDVETTPTGLTRRIVACLDVRSNDRGDLVVTKGDQYDVRESGGGEVRNLGKPVAMAERYFQQGADEVTFLNITLFRNLPIKDAPMLEVLRQAARTVFVPLTVGGGIRDVTDPDGTVVPALEVASMYFRSGADKVSIGSDAVVAAERYIANGNKGDGTLPMETISKAYGVQAVVVSVDPIRAYVASPDAVPYKTMETTELGPNGERYCYYKVTSQGGRKVHDLGVYEFVRACEALGAGEVLLNLIDRDGSNRGYDLGLVEQVKAAVEIPVIASSGAGVPAHFAEVFRETTVDAALGAGMFHRGEYTVGDVKGYLADHGFLVR